jgi:hypothetical protein
MPEFRKDVTERLKVLLSMMDLKMKATRANDEDSDSSKKPIIEIFARRGLAGDRLRIAFEHQSGDMGGGTDESERSADIVREIPMALSERPISIPGRSEGEADRTLDNPVD